MAINKEYNDIQLDVKFTQASTRANLVSEENISVSFGKISKYFADLHSQAFTGYTHPTYTAHSSGLYKITVDSKGHVSGTTAVTASDLPAHTHSDYVLKTGDTMSGNLTFAVADGSDTPGIVFKRGNFTDSSLDWKIYNSSGALMMDITVAGDTETWQNKFKVDGTGIWYGGTQVSLVGHTHSQYLPKTTYEWNKEISFGNSGYLKIGSFPMYDTNITIDINATTSKTYHGTVVIATQNVSTTSMGSHKIHVYDDPTGNIAASLRIVWTSGSRNYDIYFVPQSWSKNFIHIRALGNYMDGATDICVSQTGTAPTTTSGLEPVNILSVTSTGDGNAVTKVEIDSVGNLAVTKGSTFSTSDHTHGNITNGGALQTTDITITSGDKLVVTDSSNSNKVARASISFDGSTATKCLTQKGTWETFLASHPTITKSADTTSTASPGHGGTFTVVDSVTREANGHVTKINTKTVTLPTIQISDAGSILTPVYFSNNAPVESSGKTIPFIVGTGSTAGTWLGSLEGLTAYYDGLIILYKIPVAGASTTTLNINNLGAKTCYINNTSKLTTHFPANQPIFLVYSENQNSGCWMCLDDYWTDSDTYDRNRYRANIKAGTSALVAGNIIVGKDGVFSHLKSGGSFDISYPILYLNEAVAAEGTTKNSYDIINFTITTTQSISLTSYLPVFIKGTLSGKIFTPVSTAPLTQTVPTTDDGYQYMYLGNATSTSAVYLTERHPIYAYKNGVFGEIINYSANAGSVAWGDVTGKPSTFAPASGSDYYVKNLTGSSRSTATTKSWVSMCNSSQTGAPTLPTSGKWWHVLSLDCWNSAPNSWVSQLALPTQDDSSIYYRKNPSSGASIESGTWIKVLDALNVGYVMSPAIKYDPHARCFASSKTNSGWNAQAYSNTGYADNVYISFRPGQTTMYAMIGLDTNPSEDANYDKIDYCWYIQNNGALSVYESGTSVTITGHTTYASGDEFRVEYSCGEIRYYHNGTMCRSVARAVSGKLFFDSSFYNAGNVYDFSYGTSTHSTHTAEIIKSTYKSSTYATSLTSSAITLSDAESSFGGWICGPTKNGRIVISSYQGNNDKLYFGYGERGRTTNSYVKAMTWDGPTNTLTADKFVGALQGNADTATSATKATQDESGNNIKATYAASFSISDHTITLKNKNGTSLGTVTVPDDDTWIAMVGATSSADGSVGYVNTIPPKNGYNTKYLRADGTWAIPPGTYTHPTYTRTDTTSTASPAHGGTFTAIDSVTSTNGHVTAVNLKTITLPADNDYRVKQENTTTSAEYRVLFSGNANDTTETTTVRKSTNLKFNPNSGGLYSFGFLWTDITGLTLDIDTLTLSDGKLHSRRFIERSSGGADNITNIPVAGNAFLLEVDLIRWVSTTDYITRQRFTNAANGAYSYVRYCTSGTWGSWTTRKYTDTVTTVTTSGSGNAITSITASNGALTVTKGSTFSLSNHTHTTTIAADSGTNQLTLAASTKYKLTAGETNFIFTTPPDTKNTAGSTDTSSKIFLIGATSQAANPQTYSDDQCYVTSGTLQANKVQASVTVCANTANSNSAGGIALYSTDPEAYGVMFRGTSNSGKHGYVQSDWATYFTMNENGTTRGWVFRRGTANVASISGAGHAVFNGSVTVGGNSTNTSGCRMEYNTSTQSLDFVFV